MLAKIILTSNKGNMVFDNGANFLTKSYTFRQQNDIDHLDIEILDPRGNIINMCCVDFSMTLEIGTIYDSALYKDNNDNQFDSILSGLPNLPVISKLDRPEIINSIDNIFADNTAPSIDTTNIDQPKIRVKKKKYKFKY